MNPDGSCITCNTQQLAYQDYKGCLCSIVDDVIADEENRIIALIEKTHKHGMTHSERCAIRHDFADYLIERINGEKQ